MPGSTDECAKILTQDSRCGGQDSNCDLPNES
jgi:hypothetical protein